MADVVVLLLRLRAKIFRVLASPAARPEASRCDIVIARFAVLGLLIVDLASCAISATHRFAEAAPDWRSRTGQLMYRTQNRTVIGDVFVRFSSAGDFELTFSKGPVPLLVLREDRNFAEMNGALAGRGWSGPIDGAPQKLRGWLELRDEIVRTQDRHQ